MSHTHEVPNHLNVEDTLFLGLTSRQVATFIAFASPAYGLHDQLTVAPMVVRGALAALILTIGIAFTFIHPVAGLWMNGDLRCSRISSHRAAWAGVGLSLMSGTGAYAHPPVGLTWHQIWDGAHGPALPTIGKGDRNER
jgi:hypothetical protein